MGTALKYLLPLWGGFGVYTILGLMQWNGTFKDMSTVGDTGVYPFTKVVAKHEFTGIEGIDHLLRSLNATFWPFIDGSFPSGSLQCFQFAGQCGATWTLLSLESIREGNSWRAVSL
jgi:hypothetical protein